MNSPPKKRLTVTSRSLRQGGAEHDKAGLTTEAGRGATFPVLPTAPDQRLMAAPCPIHHDPTTDPRLNPPLPSPQTPPEPSRPARPATTAPPACPATGPTGSRSGGGTDGRPHACVASAADKAGSYVTDDKNEPARTAPCSAGPARRPCETSSAPQCRPTEPVPALQPRPPRLPASALSASSPPTSRRSCVSSTADRRLTSEH